MCGLTYTHMSFLVHREPQVCRAEFLEVGARGREELKQEIWRQRQEDEELGANLSFVGSCARDRRSHGVKSSRRLSR